VTIRELCEKEVVQLEQGVCLGRADDLAFDPATARLQSLILLGRPRLFGLLGREENLTIPWQEIETIGTDAVLVHTLGCALEARAVAEPARKAGALSRFYKKRVIFL
jgi:YlmC/YmxH family sporulation protein